MAAELFFERWRPGDQLEPEPVVDHGEPAKGEREALPVGASDIFAGRGSAERAAGLGGELLANCLHLTAAQRIDQVAREGHAAALPLGETLFNQMLRAGVHRLANLGAESTAAERDGLTRNGLPIEPGGAGRRHLMFDGKVGAHGERHATMIFIDGEAWPPSFHVTGTEDYFGMSWGFPSGQHSTPYHGVSLGSDVQEHFGKWSLYRFHIEDPVHFNESIRVTIEHGHANGQGNDYSSVAYWCQLEPADSRKRCGGFRRDTRPRRPRAPPRVPRLRRKARFGRV